MKDLKIQIAEIKEKGSLSLSFEPTAEEATNLLAVSDFQVLSPVEFSVRLSKASETVRVVIQVSYAIGFDCGRCLERQTETRVSEAEFALMSKARWLAQYDAEEVELGASDLEVEIYTDDQIDLTPLLRETLLDGIPTHPVCSESGKSQCDSAFERNIGEEAKKDLEEAKVDLRWGPLLALKKDLDN